MSILSCLPDAGTELQLHEPTVQRMQEHYSKRGVELNEARLRMATLACWRRGDAFSPLLHCLFCSGPASDLSSWVGTLCKWYACEVALAVGGAPSMC